MVPARRPLPASARPATWGDHSPLFRPFLGEEVGLGGGAPRRPLLSLRASGACSASGAPSRGAPPPSRSPLSGAGNHAASGRESFPAAPRVRLGALGSAFTRGRGRAAVWTVAKECHIPAGSDLGRGPPRLLDSHLCSQISLCPGEAQGPGGWLSLGWVLGFAGLPNCDTHCRWCLRLRFFGL